ncbi:MAG: DUF5719 family protein [Propionibacteriaceae bacterium]|nr:DUF5719 family protein [Propionibacteriaceae bacterium]
MRHHLGFLVLALVAALGIAATLVLPLSQPAPRTISLPVTRLLACPVGDPFMGKTTVSITDQTVFTAGELGALPGDPTTTATLDAPTKTVVVRGSATVGGVSVYTQDDASMAVPCSSPVTTGMWNGVSTTSGATLVMTNVDTTSAVVDVFVYGQSGPFPVPGLHDIPIAPGATQALPIDPDLVISDTPVSVQIRASKGRVLALMRVTGSTGLDWQLPETSSDTDLTIAGIPSGDGLRTLSVTNTDPMVKATISVEVMGDTGPFAPLGLETIEVPPARVVNVDLTQALGGQNSALHLTSTLPVSATVMVSSADVAAISAQQALNGTVLFPPLGGTLMVANPGTAAATLSLRYDDGTGVMSTTDTPVPAQSIMSIPFPSTGTSVKVSCDSADVRASLVLTAAGWSILPVTSGGIVTSVEVPRLAPGLG